MSIAPNQVYEIKTKSSPKDKSSDCPPAFWRRLIRVQWQGQAIAFLLTSIVALSTTTVKLGAQGTTIDQLLGERERAFEEYTLFVDAYQGYTARSRDAKYSMLGNALVAFLNAAVVVYELHPAGRWKNMNAREWGGAYDNAFQAAGKALEATNDLGKMRTADALALASADSAASAIRRINQIDAQIAALTINGAVDRLSVGAEQVEIPCPEGAVGFGLIGEEGTCYADSSNEIGPDGTPVEEMMPEEIAYELLSMCEENPRLIVCQIGETPGRFGAFCEGSNPLPGCLPSNSSPARLGGYCEGDNPAPDCFPTNP